MAIKLKCKIKAKHNLKNFNQIEKKLPQMYKKQKECLKPCHFRK